MNFTGKFNDNAQKGLIMANGDRPMFIYVSF